MNDRAQFPETARDLFRGAVLPRDHTFIQIASDSELLEHYYISAAQVNPGLASLFVVFRLFNY